VQFRTSKTAESSYPTPIAGAQRRTPMETEMSERLDDLKFLTTLAFVAMLGHALTSLLG
jgi:hypothetical protein